MSRVYTHMMNLSFLVGPDKFDGAWETLGRLAKNLSNTWPDLTVSSTLIEPPLSPETVFKVRAALREAGLNEIQIDASLQCMDDFGITYKEME